MRALAVIDSISKQLNSFALLEPAVRFRSLGFNLLISTLAVFFINGTFSYATRDSWIPDPLFRIRIGNVHKTKHGSDTGVYDTEGRFVPAKFEGSLLQRRTLKKEALSWRD